MKKLLGIISLLFVCVLFGCDESEPMITCRNCKTDFTEQYAISDFYGRTVCTECIQQQISDHINQQEEMRDSIVTYGEYIFDDEDYMVVEKSECNWCGNYAPSNLYDENYERICINCITEALHDKQVAKAIRKYTDG